MVFVLGRPSHDDEREVQLWVAHRLEDQFMVLPPLDGADDQHELVRERIFLSDRLKLRLLHGLMEDRVATLVDHVDSRLLLMQELHQVTLRLLADGDDPIRCFTAMDIFFSKGIPIEEGEQFRVLQEDQVMHGDDRLRACFFYSVGQFVAEAMVDIQIQALDILADSTGAPEGRKDAFRVDALWQDRFSALFVIVPMDGLLDFRCEEGIVVLRELFGQEPDGITAVVTQSAGIAESAFSVETYFHALVMLTFLEPSAISWIETLTASGGRSSSIISGHSTKQTLPL